MLHKLISLKIGKGKDKIQVFFASDGAVHFLKGTKQDYIMKTKTIKSGPSVSVSHLRWLSNE